MLRDRDAPSRNKPASGGNCRGGHGASGVVPLSSRLGARNSRPSRTDPQNRLIPLIRIPSVLDADKPRRFK